MHVYAVTALVVCHLALSLCAPVESGASFQTQQLGGVSDGGGSAPETLHKGFEMDKRRYILTSVSSGKRIPLYNFGLGKRTTNRGPYSFGLGKRADNYDDDDQYQNQYLENFLGELARNDLTPEYELARNDLPEEYEDFSKLGGYESKRTRPYSFGLGKRSGRGYDFGLGKRRASEEYGADKRLPNRYNFGLGRR